MNKFTKGLLLVAGMMPGALFAQKTVTVDVKANVHTISPYIYGTNEAYENSTATRWGGNRSSSYNWENNASNAGNDYSFISDNFYDYSGSNVPALPILSAVKSADSKGQYSLVSLQAVGYVAADKNGEVTKDQVAPSSRWKAISFNKNAPYSLTPNLDDDTVYIDELINYLQVKLGKAGDGGVSAFAIDNEPYLWNSTHARMHPERTTYTELIEKTVSLSKVIRNLSPGAEIYGPMFFGWTDAYRWETGETWNSINLDENYKSKYKWFVDYYLDTLSKVEKATGIRPIDVVSFHWYPESYGKTTHKRIVDLDNSVSATDLVAEDMIEARLQAPRTLWDSKYSYYGGDVDRNGNPRESYVSQQGGKAIIQKIRNSINQFYPGTKIGFTEFEFDAENHWSGGLCLVDVLGVLGKEDVYLACKWDKFQTYSEAAYNLYLNYDGRGGQYGTTSVSAVQNDTVSLSTFASVDEKGNLHIIVVNKTNEIQNTVFNIDNGLFSNGSVYGFGKMSSKIEFLGEIENIENSMFSYDLPAYSAVHFVLSAIPQAEIVDASVVAEKSISLTYSEMLSLIPSENITKDFTVVVNGVENDVLSVSVEGRNIMLGLSESIDTFDKEIFISVKTENIVGEAGVLIDFSQGKFVRNELNHAPIYVLNTEVDNLGKSIKLTLSRKVDQIIGMGGVSLEQNSQKISLDSVKVSESSAYEIVLYPSERIMKYYTSKIYNENSTDVLSVDGSGFNDFLLSLSGGANYAPVIDSAVIQDNFTVKVYFNANMDPSIDYAAAGMKILDELDSYEFTSTYSKNTRIATFMTKQPLFPDKEYLLSYEDNGTVVTIHYGVLGSFVMPIVNRMVDYGKEIVSVPGVIQAEQYWLRTGNSVVETCNDTSSLGTSNALGYISSGDLYTYKINVTEEKNYTLSVRYASNTTGSLNFIIDGEKYHLTLPVTGDFLTWSDAFRIIPLSEGGHEIVVEILKAGFNINYIEILDEEKNPMSKITQVLVPNKGNSLLCSFQTDLVILPEKKDFIITVDSLIYEVTELVPTSGTNVLCYCGDKIFYKGQTVTLQFSSDVVVTVDGGGVSDTTIIAKNNSNKVYVPIQQIAVENNNLDVIISPVPAHVNQPIVLSSGAEVSYMLISINGNIMEQGVCKGEKTIAISKEGFYSLVVSDGISSIIKRIIVE